MASAPDSEELVARLARMKQLVEALERVCGQSAEQHTLLERLRLEMEAARRALKTTPA